MTGFYSRSPCDEDKEKYSAELGKIYAEMEEAEVDRAPARAASILFGLGFTPEEQKQPTRHLLFLVIFLVIFSISL